MLQGMAGGILHKMVKLPAACGGIILESDVHESFVNPSHKKCVAQSLHLSLGVTVDSCD